MISSFYYHWEYWELNHNVTFDGINKLILINDGVTSLNVQRDIYSSWKEWAKLEQNLKYLPAITTVGGEPTVAGEKLDVTYFLINGWKLKPYPGSYDLTLVGNIFDVNGGSIKVAADVLSPFAPNNITINTNTSVIVRQITPSGSSGGLTPAESASLVNIENTVLSIQSTLASPVTASLISSQEQILTDLQSKIQDIWRLQGLDINIPLTVSPTQRAVGDITQSISVSGNTYTAQRV